MCWTEIQHHSSETTQTDRQSPSRTYKYSVFTRPEKICEEKKDPSEINKGLSKIIFAFVEWRK